MTNVISLKRVAEIGGGYAPATAVITSVYLTLLTGTNTVADSHLIDSTVILLMRGFVPMQEVSSNPEDNQFSLNTVTGELTFSVTNPTNDEQIYVLYYPTQSGGQIMGIEPVSLAEAKTHLRVTFNDDDVEIYRIITRARKYIENYCSISIVLQRIQVVANICGCWDLPYAPVVEIESVENRELYNGSGPMTYAPTTSDWGLDGNTFEDSGYPQHISTRDRFDSRTRVTYTAGGYCPDDLKAAILAQVAFMYEKRGDTTDSKCDEALELAAPYRILRWI